jgi:hypothetical protein
MAASSLRAYPFSHFLSQANGRWGAAARNTRGLQTDWGQGLAALREFIDGTTASSECSWFTSARRSPRGTASISVPASSYFAIGRDAATGPAPRFAVVSATLLAGSYLRDDPYARLRGQRPVAVVGGSLYVFDLQAVK